MPENLSFPLPALPDLHSEVQAAHLVRLDRAGLEAFEAFHTQFFEKPLQGFADYLLQTEETLSSFFQQEVPFQERMGTARRLLNQLLRVLERMRHEQLTSWQKQQAEAIHDLQANLQQLANSLPELSEHTLPTSRVRREKAGKWLKLKLRLNTQFKGNWDLKVPERMLATHYVYYASFRFLNELFDAFSQSYLAIWQRLFYLMERLAKYLRIYCNTEEQELRLQYASMKPDLEALKDELSLISQKQAERVFINYRLSLRKMASWFEHPDAQEHINRLDHHALAFTKQVRLAQKFPQTLLQQLQPAANNLYASLLLMRLQNRLLLERDQLLGLVDKEVQQWQDFAENAQTAQATTEELKSQLPEDSSLYRDVQNNAQDLLDRIRDFPERLSTYPLTEEENPAHWQPSSVIDIPLVRSLAYQLETHFLAPVQEISQHYQRELIAQKQRLLESLSLASFLEENPHTDPLTFAQPEVRPLQLQQLKSLLQPTLDRKNEFSRQIQQIASLATESLQPVKLLLQAQQLRDEWQKLQGGRIRNQVQDYASQSGRLTRNLLARLFYSGSQGFLLARKLLHEPPEGVNLARILQLRDSLKPDPLVHEQLPVHYHNLFSGQAIIGADFWVDRAVELDTFRQALQWHKDGQAGAIVVTGEPGMGATTFLRYATSRHFSQKAIFQLRPPQGGSVKPGTFQKAFQQATGLQGNLNQMSEHLPSGSVVILHDLELWWDRRPDGLAVISQILELIRQHGQRILFLCAINRFSLDTLSRLSPFSEHCILMLDLPPMDARSLQALILLRHRAGGIKFKLEKAAEDKLSEVQYARLFSKYFSQNHGNPEAAMQSWLRSITRIDSEGMHMREPYSPETDALKQLPDSWLQILATFILHKRLTQSRLQAIQQLSQEETRLWLGHLQRAGLIVSLQPKLYQISPELRHALIQELKDRDFLIL